MTGILTSLMGPVDSAGRCRLRVPVDASPCRPGRASASDLPSSGPALGDGHLLPAEAVRPSARPTGLAQDLYAPTGSASQPWRVRAGASTCPPRKRAPAAPEAPACPGSGPLPKQEASPCVHRKRAPARTGREHLPAPEAPARLGSGPMPLPETSPCAPRKGAPARPGSEPLRAPEAPAHPGSGPLPTQPVAASALLAAKEDRRLASAARYGAGALETCRTRAARRARGADPLWGGKDAGAQGGMRKSPRLCLIEGRVCVHL